MIDGRRFPQIFAAALAGRKVYLPQASVQQQSKSASGAE
jgi:hypothetical protein